MDRIDLSGQVAVVTGAGRGIGRSHAQLLAARGASVVVNDVAIEPTGESRALTVVNEICAAGGNAVASNHDVAAEASGRQLVDFALDSYGRVDILIHNAGMTIRTIDEQNAGRLAPFSDTDIGLVRANVELNLMSAFYVGQPAWAAMAEQGYGRILFTTSITIFGGRQNSAYSASKAGLVGMVATLAAEARESGQDIAINALAPMAATAAHHEEDDERFQGFISPDNVAPAALLLVSPMCPVRGQCLNVGGSYVGRMFLGLTRGWAAGHEPLTPELVAEHFDESVALDGYSVPSSLAEVKDAMLVMAVKGT